MKIMARDSNVFLLFRPMSESDRAAAEAALRRRDRDEGRRVRGMRRGLLYDDESDDEVRTAFLLS